MTGPALTSLQGLLWWVGSSLWATGVKNSEARVLILVWTHVQPFPAVEVKVRGTATTPSPTEPLD